MPPQELIGRYKEYKTKTRGLVHWLTQTARTCCDLTTVVRSLNQNAASTKTAQANGELEIRPHELLNLANEIASADPPVDVPEGIILITQDVIAGREGCAEWYSAQALEGGSKMAKENDGHRYFIEVLRRLLKTLEDARIQSLSKAQSSKTKAEGNKGVLGAVSMTVLGSLFHSLELEEPTTHPLGLKPNRDAPNTAQTATPTRFTLEKTNEDNAFKTWCFLQDLSDVREFINNIWMDYMRGDVSLLSAGVMTDTALVLLRRADDEFSETSPFGSTDWLELLRFLGIDYFVQNGAIWMRPTPGRDLQEPRMPTSSVNIVELLCPVAYLCLQHWKVASDQICKLEQRLKDGAEV